jgi:hypothetical protein
MKLLRDLLVIILRRGPNSRDILVVFGVCQTSIGFSLSHIIELQKLPVLKDLGVFLLNALGCGVAT